MSDLMFDPPFDRPTAPSRPRRWTATRALAALSVGALLAGVVVAAPDAHAAAGAVSGTVYRDANNNGVKDAGEAGVAGVVIASAGAATTTASNGTWSLAVSGTTTVQAFTGWFRSR